MKMIEDGGRDANGNMRRRRFRRANRLANRLFFGAVFVTQMAGISIAIWRQVSDRG
jgi:hypothetical protein